MLNQLGHASRVEQTIAFPLEEVSSVANTLLKGRGDCRLFLAPGRVTTSQLNPAVGWEADEEARGLEHVSKTRKASREKSRLSAPYYSGTVYTRKSNQAQGKQTEIRG